MEKKKIRKLRKDQRRDQKKFYIYKKDIQLKI